MLPSGIAAVALIAAYSFADAQVAIPGWAQAGGAAAPASQPALTVQPIPGQTGAATVQDWRSATTQLVQPVSPADQSIDATIAEWRRLQQNDVLGFSAYAGFLLTNPGWPSEDRMRRLAEAQADPSGYNSTQTIAFFSRFPPTTATGEARYAFALASANRANEARDAARRAWVGGTLNVVDEQRLMSLFAGAFTPEDHARRADILLWVGDRPGAQRVSAWLSPARRTVVDARIAMQSKWPDAAQRIAAADAYGLSDGGYLADKSKWLRDSNDWGGARTILADRQTLATPVAAPEKWYETLLTAARAAGNDTNWTTAYAIASKVDDAFPAGTDVSDKAIGVRDDYTSLTWLAGTAALNRLGRPADAIGMFTRYAGGARSPQTISKGYYWAGRAASAAGREREAQEHFRRASIYPDQYYGQLSLERLGQPVPLPAGANRTAVVSDAERQAFANRTVVRAARRLGATGNWQDQSRFLRAIANGAATEQEHILIGELAQSLARPDLGVMAGRRALSSGLSGQTNSSFPRVSVPEEHGDNWTMIHAIARQESQFDRQIVSSAGARGLMQLMPGTARETAGKLGMGYDISSLNEPGYNIRLGSTYFQRMMIYYNGSYPLAVAAYNAGPGNVNKWLRANGDPRQGGDIVQWIEDIPIFETRNYVQRVLENAVVYDQLNPRTGGLRTATPLSRYLGKNRPG
ncbi:lytic transglycosylase domain-containing protein [Sphingobium sufflavum]|uniref:lytic transglycosylase domain-containing protein n=1 Tax=Sphingobium sufflavum TaxID=1129547 RepID=UPI001F22A239|nr:lytic transglycosylase domain-containing protein [Sphingobium sufflavum]MCE7798354.1 lytic transglycosylase domain-containing protein [Sphingobium sufflavum]